eukprot:3819757-Rhodomonas_salina.1
MSMVDASAVASNAGAFRLPSTVAAPCSAYDMYLTCIQFSLEFLAMTSRPVYTTRSFTRWAGTCLTRLGVTAHNARLNTSFFTSRSCPVPRLSAAVACRSTAVTKRAAYSSGVGIQPTVYWIPGTPASTTASYMGMVTACTTSYASFPMAARPANWGITRMIVRNDCAFIRPIRTSITAFTARPYSR